MWVGCNLHRLHRDDPTGMVHLVFALLLAAVFVAVVVGYEVQGYKHDRMRY